MNLSFDMTLLCLKKKDGIIMGLCLFDGKRIILLQKLLPLLLHKIVDQKLKI